MTTPESPDLRFAFARLLDDPEIGAPILSALEAEGGLALSQIRKGCLVGLSGGADSVFLLGCLVALRERIAGDFPIVAAHLNHGIRGEEADRDEAFAASFATKIGVEFLLRRTDVPALAKQDGIGIEEAARNARFSFFNDIIRSRIDVKTICLAHNATDRIETFLFRLLRGSGGDGLAAMPVVRENIVRPLLYLGSDTIRSSLADAGVPFVVDSTNSDLSYSRNAIRHRLLPLLEEIRPGALRAVSRAAELLAEDRAYLRAVAGEFLAAHPDGEYPQKDLAALPPAIFGRVLILACEPFGFSPDSTAISAVRARISQNPDFRLPLGRGYLFHADGAFCRILPEKKNDPPLMIPLPFGQNKPGGEFLADAYDALIAYCPDQSAENAKFPLYSKKIYKFDTKADLTSAIIEGELYIRSRRDGDAYFYKGMTHKVKKLCNDKKIPPEDRDSIPVICDRKGIVWIPGFGVRDDGGSEPKSIALYHLPSSATDAAILRLASISAFRGVLWKKKNAEIHSEKKGSEHPT